MEFDTESDPEFLIELFGDDAHSLAECVVYPIRISRMFTQFSEVLSGYTFSNVDERSKSGTHS
jgi:hypothetical protein